MWKVALFVLTIATNPFNGWETLSLLTITKQYDDLLGEELDVPVFSRELKAFEGREVSVTGYVIPIEQSGAADYFVLSRFPYNSCFFCGNAGPETVAEVYTTERFDFSDQKVEVHGVLRLNSGDPFHLFYILEDARVKVLD